MQHTKLPKSCTAVSFLFLSLSICYIHLTFFSSSNMFAFPSSPPHPPTFARHDSGFYVMLYAENFNGKVMVNFSKVLQLFQHLHFFTVFCLRSLILTFFFIFCRFCDAGSHPKIQDAEGFQDVLLYIKRGRCSQFRHDEEIQVLDFSFFLELHSVFLVQRNKMYQNWCGHLIFVFFEQLFLVWRGI